MILFKDLKLNKSELLWINAIYENGGISDPRTFRVKFHDQLPPNFTYGNLEQTFIWDNRLNIFGIWISNPKDKIFENLDKVIKAIKGVILKNPKLASITAEEVSKLAGISVNEAKEALGQLIHHPGFYTSARGDEFGQDIVGFSGDGHIVPFLNYKDIPSLLEKTWETHRMDLIIRPDEAENSPGEELQLCHTYSCHSVFFGDEIWSFHGNAAQVVKVLIQAYKKGFKELHINDIHGHLPQEIESQSLSQIFKRNDKKTNWKKLVLIGPSGKSFYQLNPKYVKNGVKEITFTA